ncbi:lipopolysaccharide assembly protein LapB [Methylococcus sp. EFPC2]|uniref:tetratricopeptide repeat protein n=1 Tax=Methylococcus sp. EFPC2 TaxID=2812648 RepID=UPI0019688F83|nr:MxaK protein [Methylococcus sp. EFPC2]QSA98434.1 MxaK protein [Methylococcus sp. EFPC2]
MKLRDVVRLSAGVRTEHIFSRGGALPIWFYALAVLVLVGLAVETVRVYEASSLQNALAHPAEIEIDDDTPPLLVFAKARSLEQSGEREEAIRLYGSLAKTEDPDLRERALHNLATGYLREGAALWHSRGVLEYSRVNTLVELAKDNYREVLRLNPGNAGARHNLEYAYRITPPPREKPKADFQGRKASIFATLPGLPGGGP